MICMTYEVVHGMIHDSNVLNNLLKRQDPLYIRFLPVSQYLTISPLSTTPEDSLKGGPLKVLT